MDFCSVFGGLTFIGANYLFHLTAEHAEIVEGSQNIVASLILFQVGVWFVSKAEANKWKDILNQIQCAISNRDRSHFYGSFLRCIEVFETILFYKALLLQFDSEYIFWVHSRSICINNFILNS